MVTRKTRVNVYEVPVDITEDGMGAFFAQYGHVGDVLAIIAGIATGKFVLQVTMTHKNLSNFPAL